jgi:hypothetical protein
LRIQVGRVQVASVDLFADNSRMEDHLRAGTEIAAV